jgi:archaemetzincin
MQFTPPGDQARREAIGDTRSLPASMRWLLDPKSFEPIPRPGAQDWLANHPEPGQTFDEFLNSHPNRPDALRHTIYLQPLDEFPSDGPQLASLKQWTEAFFSMAVRVLPVIAHESENIHSRTNPATRNLQLLTRDILSLLAQRLPRDAFCLLGITLRDLYPAPSWNFVFGEASLRERVGVYSFARYGESKRDRTRIMLRRSCKVLAHETGHMFGIEHCIYFRCLMNGSNHIAESDARPLHLCAVDLRKLYASVGFDPVSRYAHLQSFCRENGFDDEARWLEAQLARVAA